MAISAKSAAAAQARRSAFCDGKPAGAGTPLANRFGNPFQLEQEIAGRLPAVLRIFRQATPNGAVKRRRVNGLIVLIGEGSFSRMDEATLSDSSPETRAGPSAFRRARRLKKRYRCGHRDLCLRFAPATCTGKVPTIVLAA